MDIKQFNNNLEAMQLFLKDGPFDGKFKFNNNARDRIFEVKNQSKTEIDGLLE